MKTNSDFILREIAGDAVLIPTGKASQTMNGMIRLTPRGIDVSNYVFCEFV